MGTKRSAADAENPDFRRRRQDSKRMKYTPPTETNHDSSEPSSCSVSEDSALQSSPPASNIERESSLSSIQSPASEDESISSLDESETSSSGDDEIITIGGPKKPQMMGSDVTGGAQGLRTRLDALLPQLAASNSLLASSGTNPNMEEVEDGEQHIEMNLGLGVLEEQRSEESDKDGESSSEDKNEHGNGDRVLLSSDPMPHSQPRRNLDVMGKLFGQSRSRERKRPGIEDMG